MVLTDTQKTEWFIAEAAKYGIHVRRRSEAPNGGEQITFDMPMDVDPTKKFRRPYFMIWTGTDTDREYFRWHVEFGHWYFPKNDKERRAYPTTEYFKDEELAGAIKKYADEIQQEAQS